MLSKLGSHVRHNVVGYLALFLALSGTAVGASAALKVGDPATGDLTGTYPGPSIAANAVGTNEVDGSLTGSDVSDTGGGTLTGADILESSLGKVGDADTLDGLNSTGFGAGAVLGQAHCDTCSGPGARTFYMAPSGPSDLDPSTAHLDRVVELTPNAVLHASDLAVRVQASWTGGVGAQATITLRVELTDTSVSCTVVFDDGPICHSGNAIATIPAGSAVYLQIETNSGVGFVNTVLFGWRLTGPV